MLKLVLLFLGFCLSSSMALRCIACAHDPATAEMEDCVGTIDPGVAGGLIRNCTNPDDNLCFTKVTWEPALGENTLFNRRWNRGCCHRKAGDPNCPMGGSDHEKTDYYEIWRSRCTEEGCNSQTPAGGGSGGGGEGAECTESTPINDCRIFVPVKRGIATQNLAGILGLVFAMTTLIIS